MSIVVFGPLVTGARGTIAGTIFSANKSGPYARGWNRGPNPRSIGQAGQRGRTSGMAKTWRGLTQLQRDAWDTWAALPAQEKFNSLGESYFPSGFNWYVAINTRLLYVGRGSRTAPPVTARPAAGRPPLRGRRRPPARVSTLQPPAFPLRQGYGGQASLRRTGEHRLCIGVVARPGRVAGPRR